MHTAPAATPLFYAIVRPAEQWGLRETPMRMPSALLGVAGVGAAMLLLASLFGARVGLAAGLVLAAAPLEVSSARTALPFTLVAAASTAWAWSLSRLLQTARGWWLAAILGGVALHAGYAVFAVAGAAILASVLALSGLGSRIGALRTLAAVVGALVAFGPWAIYDLATEPAPQRVLPPNAWAEVGALPIAALFGGDIGDPPERIVAVAVAVLALGGLGLSLRRRPVAAVFAAGLIVFTVGGVLTMAQLGPQTFSPAQTLAALPPFLGLAAVAVEALAGFVPLRGFQSTLCASAAVALVVLGELPAGRALRVAPNEDWRASFEVLLRNLGRDERVAAPLARGPTEFYGEELGRRMPIDFRTLRHAGWLRGTARGWLIAPRETMNDSHWPLLAQILRSRTVVDLSPSDDPMVLLVGSKRSVIWDLACAFELPPAVIARGAFLRDCLREIGVGEGSTRQIKTLVASEGVSLRNPTLLDAVRWLASNGHVPLARDLAQSIVRHEGAWSEAKKELAALPPA